LERLAGGRVHVEGHVRHRLAALHDLGDGGEVAEAGIGRGPDHDLVDGLALDVRYGYDVAGARRLGDEGNERGEVDLLFEVVGGVGIGDELDPVVLPSLGR